jgi:hypothetical protein
MRRLLLVPFVCLLLFACEGKQGPMGPEGPSGATIVYLYGNVGPNNYDGNFIGVYNTSIEDDAFVQVCLSPDLDEMGWLNCSDYDVMNDWVYIYDPDQYFLGWEYMIMMVNNTADEGN